MSNIMKHSIVGPGSIALLSTSVAAYAGAEPPNDPPQQGCCRSGEPLLPDDILLDPGVFADEPCRVALEWRERD